jgi:DNA-binding SARP family transcriptional activator
MGTDLGGRLQFRLLGPLEASRGGEALRLGGERQRALLALLLAHAPQTHLREHSGVRLLT